MNTLENRISRLEEYVGMTASDEKMVAEPPVHVMKNSGRAHTQIALYAVFACGTYSYFECLNDAKTQAKSVDGKLIRFVCTPEWTE